MVSIKKFYALTAVLSFILLTSPPAQSADLGGNDFNEPPSFPVSAKNWTGFWVGLGGGYGAVNSDVTVLPAGGGLGINLDGLGGDGGIFTVGGGYDFQIGAQWVLGAFADYDWTGMQSTFSVPSGAATVKLDAKYQYAVGVKTGFLANPGTLIYVTGGWTRFEYDGPNLTNAAIAGVVGSPKFDGWFLGGGVETMLGSWFGNNNVTLKAEYRYADYGNEALGVAGTAAAGALVPSVEPSTHTGRFSINYKFN